MNMTISDKQEEQTRKASPPDGEARSIQNLLQIPWQGLRPDLMLHPGPVDFDGQRSWVLEDPVRGSNFRLGYAEGELLYRLLTHPDIDSAVRSLYTTTTLRPPVQEILSFISMLQRERLARMPDETVIREETESGGGANPTLIQQILKGNIFFRVPLLRPDAFLSHTLPWVSVLWSPLIRWLCILCGFTGLTLTLQEIENYLGTVSYLFTPAGGLAFFVSLLLLKIGHEFGHAYAAKSMGLHVRSMGVMFIVVWPLLYTDTTDVWKMPDRRRRIRVSLAGVRFEMAVAGIALMLWAFLPDGILRSLMFFLSGTSLFSSVFINLNPFMRYDGYYFLMDFWGIDNLRPRAAALLRHAVRRLLLDWQGPVPEIHPQRGALIVYGLLAALYRIFIGISIAIGIYYLFFPALGLIVLAVDLWLFLILPFRNEIRAVVKGRQHWGSRRRLAVTACGFAGICILGFAPLPKMLHVPCLLMARGAIRVEATSAGQLADDLPRQGQEIHRADLLARISSDPLLHEMQKVRFELEKVRASVRALGSGGEQGAYRKWLLAEQARLRAALDKYAEAVAQLEIRSPLDGRVTDVNPDLYAGASVARGAWLFTVAAPEAHELKAYVHETRVDQIKEFDETGAQVRFQAPELPPLSARLVEKGIFPVRIFPNNSLFDVAGGPIDSVADQFGRRPRDAYFVYTFDVPHVPEQIANGMPSWVWMKSRPRPLVVRWFGVIWNNIVERGLF
ncbi:hemolysin D [Desulfonema ishimotonii]|uniref:Hemolysin D n=1 Tax=Desulfonema ishimotonii TaxID=45657 RepID=A0A401FRK5_9BACT|nr:site-2 protease family protein [Desulfonema ishimotonii]GBC59602.1 hemolysin D [Desulfonema ishimotonii]